MACGGIGEELMARVGPSGQAARQRRVPSERPFSEPELTAERGSW
jgi:hypothetical protein